MATSSLRSLAAAALFAAAAATGTCPSAAEASTDDTVLLQRSGKPAQETLQNANGPALVGYGDDPALVKFGVAQGFQRKSGGITGTAEVYGRVAVKAFKGPNLANSGMQLSFHLLDVDRACTSGPGLREGSCGVHVHQGTCAAVGPRLYSSAQRARDPWDSVTYTSEQAKVGSVSTMAELGLFQAQASFLLGQDELMSERSRRRYLMFNTKGTVSVYTGQDPETIVGAVLVVYDFDGVVMSCAPIAPTKEAHPALLTRASSTSRPLKATDFVKVPDYEGPTATGQVLIFERMGETPAATGQLVSWTLEGVDPRCAKGPLADVSKSCGVHIEAGGCSDPYRKGDIYDTQEVFRNPWGGVGYTSLQAGEVVKAVDHEVPALTGVASPMTVGHVVMLYDSDGAPMACAAIAPSA